MTAASSSAATSMVIAFCYGWMAPATPTGFSPSVSREGEWQEQRVGLSLPCPQGQLVPSGETDRVWAAGCDLRYIKPKSRQNRRFLSDPMVLKSRTCEGSKARGSRLVAAAKLDRNVINGLQIYYDIWKSVLRHL